jgi:pyruvate formate lyase activating enzyme
MCKQAGLHTAIETTGMARWETLEKVLKYVDLILYDLKHMDPKSHQKYTGASNDLILKNLRRIRRNYTIPIVARIPIIPGYNADLKNIEDTARFIVDEMGSDTKVNILAYHRLGETKYDRLERDQSGVCITPPNEGQMADIQKTIEAFGLTVFIGG